MTRRIAHLDVLGETRRAMRILRRVERYLLQQERAAKRAGEKRKAKFARELEAGNMDALELLANASDELGSQP
jgi:hypothetical protein